jgi:hypothetical protein
MAIINCGYRECRRRFDAGYAIFYCCPEHLLAERKAARAGLPPGSAPFSAPLTLAPSRPMVSDRRARARAEVLADRNAPRRTRSLMDAELEFSKEKARAQTSAPRDRVMDRINRAVGELETRQRQDLTAY